MLFRSPCLAHRALPPPPVSRQLLKMINFDFPPAFYRVLLLSIFKYLHHQSPNGASVTLVREEESRAKGQDAACLEATNLTKLHPSMQQSEQRPQTFLATATCSSLSWGTPIQLRDLISPASSGSAPGPSLGRTYRKKPHLGGIQEAQSDLPKRHSYCFIKLRISQTDKSSCVNIDFTSTKVTDHFLMG